jgi:hypothetical protein
MVSRPVCPGVRRPSGTCDQFFFLLKISFRQLRVRNFVEPSLTRGRVCKLLYNCFWALPEQSLLGRSPVELTAIFYCLIWDSTILEGQVPIFSSHVSAVILPNYESELAQIISRIVHIKRLSSKEHANRKEAERSRKRRHSFIIYRKLKIDLRSA